MSAYKNYCDCCRILSSNNFSSSFT